MMNIKGISKILICAVALAAHSFVLSDPIAIVGATIIDGTGAGPKPNSIVVVENGRIALITDDQSLIPPNANQIDALGKYIIPGLMDANVHLSINTSPEYFKQFHTQLEDLITEATQITLKAGVTTVFDSWGPLDALKAVRDDINLGHRTGSRLYFAGNIVGLDGPLSPDFNPNAGDLSADFVADINRQWVQGVGRSLLYMSAEDVVAAVRKYIAKDIDFFKYGVSGHGGMDPNNMGFLLFSPRVQELIIKEARKAGLHVQTHTTSVESLRVAAESDTDLMQHCGITLLSVIPDETVNLIADRGIYCSFNMYTNAYIKSQLGDLINEDPTNLTHLGRWKRSLRVADINQRKLIKAGVPAVLSTDGGVPWGPKNSLGIPDDDNAAILGVGHIIWIKAALEKGMTPMQALLAATLNIARAYGVDSDLGTVEAGKIADLIILNKNPLKNPANYAAIHQIYKAGELVTREALPTRRVLTKHPENSSDCEVIIATDLGDINARLFVKKAPNTVKNFLANIRQGLYQNGHFYRSTIADRDDPRPLSVVQGGLNGSKIPRPPIAHEPTSSTGLSHLHGSLSMARHEPGSASSEFFITIGDNRRLNYESVDRPGYAVFGQVLTGHRVLEAIQARPTGQRQLSEREQRDDWGEGKFYTQLLNDSVRFTDISIKNPSNCSGL